MKETPLAALHRQMGADMGTEAGWVLPRQFRSLLSEHHAAHAACAIFDISHFGKFRLVGSGADEWLESMLSNDVKSCYDGRLQKTLLLRPNGVILDRMTLYRESAGRFYLIGSASLADVDFEKLRKNLQNPSLVLTNRTDELCAMALCGPDSGKVLGRVLREIDIPEQGCFRVFGLRKQRCLLSRGGLVTTDSIELFCPAVKGIEWFERLMAAGATPCGTDTREYLRVEGGFSDMTRDTVGLLPQHAGWEELCSAQKEYMGGAALHHPQSSDGQLISLQCSTSEVSPVAGNPVHDMEGRRIGTITSAACAPDDKHSVALAYVTHPHSCPGTHLHVVVGNHAVPAKVTGTPVS